MNCLLLGGTSFFGKHIVHFFREAGYRVHIFTRGQKKPKEFLDWSDLVWINGERRHSEALKRLSDKHWDVVIDNIAYQKSDIELFFHHVRNVDHYMFTSSYAVYRYRNPRVFPPFKESDAPFFKGTPSNQKKEIIIKEHTSEDLQNPHWIYARGKLECELYIEAHAPYPWTIIRPPVLYGPWDPTERGFWYLARLIQQDNDILLYQGGVHAFRLCSSYDAARVFLLAHEKSARTKNMIYNVAQQEIITLREFLELHISIIEKMGKLKKKPELIHVLPPKEAQEGEALEQFLEIFCGPYSDPIMHSCIPSLMSVRKDLSYQSIPIEKLCEDTTHWFMEHYSEDQIKGLLKDRKFEVELIKKIKKFDEAIDLF